MSYDVSLHIGPPKPCPTCGHSALESGKEVFTANHTSNTAGMWRKAGCDLASYNGKLASQLAGELGPAILKIELNPVAYREFEPDNGWGTVLSTLSFLREIYSACLEHPGTVVCISK